MSCGHVASTLIDHTYLNFQWLDSFFINVWVIFRPVPRNTLIFLFGNINYWDNSVYLPIRSYCISYIKSKSSQYCRQLHQKAADSHILHRIAKKYNVAEQYATFWGFFWVFCCFTSHVNSYGHCGTVSSLNHTFPWAGLSKGLTSNLCTYFRL